jgi:pimeloyl-ACP methyl ester carboxylesterase
LHGLPTYLPIYFPAATYLLSCLHLPNLPTYPPNLPYQTNQPTNPPPKMPSKTIVLVPGSFSPSDVYLPLAEPLRAAGLTVHLLDPPSYYTKKAGAPPTVYDDAAFIASFVRGLVDAGEEIVVLAHSYGGTPTSQALEGLTVRERREKGEKGGVARVGFITAVVPPVGTSVMEFMGTPAGGEQPYEADAVGYGLFLFLGSFLFFSLSTAFWRCSSVPAAAAAAVSISHQLTHSSRTAGS